MLILRSLVVVVYVVLMIGVGHSQDSPPPGVHAIGNGETIAVTGVPTPISTTGVSVTVTATSSTLEVRPVGDLLRGIAGVDVSPSIPDDLNVVRFRGARSADIEARFDRIPLNVPGGQGMYLRWPVAEFGTIEAVKGPQSGRFGSEGLGGTLQLTQRPIPHQWKLSTSYSGQPRVAPLGHVNASRGAKDLSWSAGVSRLHGRTLHDLSEYKDNFQLLRLDKAWNSSATSRITLLNFRGDLKAATPTPEETPEPQAVPDQPIIRTVEYAIGPSAQFESARLLHQIDYSYHKASRSLRGETPALSLSGDRHHWAYRAVFKKNEHRLFFNTEADIESLKIGDVSRTRKRVGYAAGAQLNPTDRIFLFGQARLDVGDTFKVTPGWQLSSAIRLGNGNDSWLQRFRLHAAAGRGLAQNDCTGFSDANRNAERAELDHSLGLEAGVDHRPAEWLYLDLVYQWHRIQRGTVQPCSNSELEETLRGFEFRSSFKVGNSRSLGIQFTYGWLIGRSDDTADLLNPRLLAPFPRQSGSFSVQYNREKCLGFRSCSADLLVVSAWRPSVLFLGALVISRSSQFLTPSFTLQGLPLGLTAGVRFENLWDELTRSGQDRSATGKLALVVTRSFFGR